MPKVLIIDDEKQVCDFLVASFKDITTNVQYALTLAQGLEQLYAQNFDVIFLDVNLPDGNGINAIKIIRALPSAPEVIIITADSDPDGAELAMKSDAWDYIPKTVSHKHLKLSLTRALKYRQQKNARPVLTSTVKRDSIIGQSEIILKCLEMVSKAAENDMPVLITGDTGTGKELFARAIHENSARHTGEFVVVDCAALPDHLVESILFGHKKGAFTGAESDKTGLLEMADNGTLFLDELGEMPIDIQKKFLRALQEKKIRPLGSRKEIKSNFRLVAATHQDIYEMTQTGRFRKDLYYRIVSLQINLPSLKERIQDIPLIAEHHIAFKNNLLKKQAFKMSESFISELEIYPWPGNIRELKHAIDSACSQVLHGEEIYSQHLPEHIRAFNIRKKITPKNTPKIEQSKILPLKDHIEKTKHDYLIHLLVRTKGDIQSCCKFSGISRGHLYNLFKRYNIKP